MKKLRIGKYILIVCFGIILGFCLLIFAFLLPVSPMKEHVLETKEVLEQEGISPMLNGNYSTMRLDNYSDGLLLNSAIYNGEENTLNKAAAIYQYTYEGMNYYQSLLAYMEGKTGVTVGSYARDWHGYLIYLKPLLLIMNYSEIRMLNMFLQIILVFGVVKGMIKKGLDKYVMPLAVSLFFMSWNILFMSMEYSALFYVSMVAVYILLNKRQNVDQSDFFSVFFIIVGMSVSYIDVLTYPILTLGIPLVFIYLLYGKCFKSVKEEIIFLFKSIIAWGFGYGGMWGGKWIIASLFTNKNVIKEAILMVLYRMSSESSDTGTLMTFNVLDVFKRNFGVYSRNPYLIILVVLFLVFLIKVMKIRNKINFTGCIPLVLICFMPVGWYIIIGNHSFVHYWMTHRNLVLSVFSGLCLMIKMFFDNRLEEN